MGYGVSNYLPMASVSAACTFSLEAIITICSSSISVTAFSLVVKFVMISWLARSAPLVSSIHLGKYIKIKIIILSNETRNRCF